NISGAGDENYNASAQRLTDYVARMNENYQPDFVITNSDYINGHTNAAASLADLQFIDSIYDDLEMDRYYVFGNHDVALLTKEQLIANTGAEAMNYSFDVNGWH